MAIFFMSEIACMTDVNRLRPVITNSTSVRNPSIITCNSFISLIVRISRWLPSVCFHSFACCSMPTRRELRLMLLQIGNWKFEFRSFFFSFNTYSIYIVIRMCTSVCRKFLFFLTFFFLVRNECFVV